jgi:hypothetical protein
MKCLWKVIFGKGVNRNLMEISEIKNEISLILEGMENFPLDINILNRISELSKHFRNEFSCPEFIPFFEKDLVLKVREECIRPLSNMCADNDDFREHLISKSRIPHILLDYLSNYCQISSSLRYVILVFLFNLCCGFDRGRDFLVEDVKIIESFVETLLSNISNEISVDLLDILLTSKEAAEQFIFYFFSKENLSCNLKNYADAEIILNILDEVFSNHDIYVELDTLINLVSNEKYGLKVGKIVANLVGKDLYAANCFSFYPVFLSWVKCPPFSDINIRSYGMICLGNIARSDKNCVEMVRNGLIEFCLEILEHEDTDFQLKYATVSLLKNLSFAKENKSSFAEKGVLNKILPDIAAPNSFTLTVIGIFKNLSDISEYHLYSDVIFQLTKSDDEGIRYEALRWFHLKLRNNSNLKAIYDIGGVELMNQLLDSKHLVLKNEGVIGLMLLFSYLCRFYYF